MKRIDDASQKFIWVPNLRWFFPHRFAISLDRLTQSVVEPALTRHYLQFAVLLQAASARDIHYYLEPTEVSFRETREAAACDNDNDNDNDSLSDEERSQEEPLARLLGYHPAGTLNGIVVWRTHQLQLASIPDERIAMSEAAVAGPTAPILVSGLSFMAMSGLLFWISLTATELGEASQREHGYGAVFALALGVIILVLTLLYRASWRRYWRQLKRGVHTAG